MNVAAVEWGSVPAWISAVTPLIMAGVITRAMNRTTASIKEAVRTAARPRTLRGRLRSSATSRTGPDQAIGAQAPEAHHGDLPDSGE